MLGLSPIPTHPGLRLIRDHRMDDNPAFQEIVQELERPLLHYLERYVGGRPEAQDLLQITLTKMSKGLSTFAGRSSIKTWAFSIASRVAADYYRHPDRRQKIVELSETAEPIDPEQVVDEQIIIGEMNDCIRGIIDSLPEDYRSALLLCDFEGLSAKQIAKISDCSLATAKIRIHRARQRLKKAMQKQCEFYHDSDGVFRCDRKN